MLIKLKRNILERVNEMAKEKPEIIKFDMKNCYRTTRSMPQTETLTMLI